jgi:hypothetical protein
MADFFVYQHFALNNIKPAIDGPLLLIMNAIGKTFQAALHYFITPWTEDTRLEKSLSGAKAVKAMVFEHAMSVASHAPKTALNPCRKSKGLASSGA